MANESMESVLREICVHLELEKVGKYMTVLAVPSLSINLILGLHITRHFEMDISGHKDT